MIHIATTPSSVLNLKTKPFGTARAIEWNDHEVLVLAKIILGLISHNEWDKVLSIEESTYREITLDVLSTIEIIRPSKVAFQVFGRMHTMTDIQFGYYLGLYDEEFMNSSSSHDLPVDFPKKMTYTRF